ncbi:DUF3299 domain-containing protein [Ascidiaceihabitans sp.]|uniref:DUF3299 domain-containing protein n=1 Tax=Ascidiaceihabitans sp. TaxID=1872644 RepID=UPI0032974ECF
MADLSRRTLISVAAAFGALPQHALAASPKIIGWEDLIPAGVPYGEIIGQGEIDALNDTWLPEFDENASKLNKDLHGAYIKMPGYILPIDVSTKGVTSFILVPYVGACIHTPPPPANQLVFVDSKKPWPSDKLWDPVWVTGRMRHEMQSTSVADIGYALTAEAMEVYVW